MVPRPDRTGVPGRGGQQDLGLEPGRLDQGGLADLGRQGAIGDEEDIALEVGSLVTGPDLGDHSVDLHRGPVGQAPLEGHHVVELHRVSGGHRHPELERGGVLDAEDATDE